MAIPPLSQSPASHKKPVAALENNQTHNCSLALLCGSSCQIVLGLWGVADTLGKKLWIDYSWGHWEGELCPCGCPMRCAVAKQPGTSARAVWETISQLLPPVLESCRQFHSKSFSVSSTQATAGPSYWLKYVAWTGLLNRGFTGTKRVWVNHKGWLQLAASLLL